MKYVVQRYTQIISVHYTTSIYTSTNIDSDKKNEQNQSDRIYSIGIFTVKNTIKTTYTKTVVVALVVRVKISVYVVSHQKKLRNPLVKMAYVIVADKM